MTNCCLGNYCKSPANKPSLICGLCRKFVHSVVLGCAIGPACELPPHHHVYQRTLLPFGDPARLSSSAHICLACSENATKNIAPLLSPTTTPMPMTLHDLHLAHNHHNSHHADDHDDDTEDAADLLLKKDLTTALLRRRYTLEDKYDVVTKVKDDGSNKKEVAEQFGINKATLNAWLRQKKAIIKQCKGVHERQRFSYQQKHDILSKIKEDKSNKKEIMDAFGIKKHTLNTWLRHRVDIARTSEDLPARKANYHSAIWRIHEGVDAFFAENQMRHGNDRINITGYVLGVHANKVKDELLERHAKKEIVLEEQEIKHLMKFKGSDSWGRKYAKAKGWRGPEYRKLTDQHTNFMTDDGNRTNNAMMIRHHHHDGGDSTDSLEQHATHHQPQQHGDLSANHGNSNNSNNTDNINGIGMNNMDSGNKPDESFGYHMYAHNIQQMNHLTIPQTNTMDPLSNLQHAHMHHPQHQLHAATDNSIAQPNMLSQHQQQQVMQQQIQHHHHHQTMQQQQHHTMDNSLVVGHDPNRTTGMQESQLLQQQTLLHTDVPPNVADPRSYNAFA